MKPIATIHWMERGQVQKHECYTEDEIVKKEHELLTRGKFTWTDMAILTPGILQRLRKGQEAKFPS